MPSTDDQLVAVLTELNRLRAKVQVLEDKDAIMSIVVRYGMCADSGDNVGASADYADDAVVELGGGLTFPGAAGIRAMLGRPDQQAMAGRTAHTGGPFDVIVTGDRAVATGYFRTYVASENGNVLTRLSYTRLEFARRDGRWVITRRDSRPVSTPGAADLLHAGIAEARS